MSTSSDVPTPQQAHDLSQANLIAVFSQRDPAARLAAVQKTYHKDVQFYEPGQQVVVSLAVPYVSCRLLGPMPQVVFSSG